MILKYFHVDYYMVLKYFRVVFLCCESTVVATKMAALLTIHRHHALHSMMPKL